MLKPDGRVIMVSGASRGIGRAVVERLLASGFRISAGMRTVEEPWHDRMICCRYEAEEAGSAEAWVAATVAHFGRLDGLVNAAGIAPQVPLIDGDEEELDRLWRINVKGPWRMIRAAYPHLVKAGNGRVVNLGSLAGKRAVANVGYSMSKFALTALNHGLRAEGWNTGIRATLVAPGYVATDMTVDVQTHPREKMIQADDLAELIETALNLPSNAGVSELLVHCRYEPML